MAAVASAPPLDQEFEQRVTAEIERAIRRNIRGLEDVSLRLSEQTGVTPHDTIHARGTMKLHHYRPTEPEVYRVPIVLVMSLVSKAYILDLTPGQSLVEYLVRSGFDIYMIDWGIPRPQDKNLRLENYVLDFIPECLEKVAEDSGEPEASLVGYCMGGLLALMYAGLHVETPPKNLVTLATPVNADGMELFSKWSDKRYFDVDRIVDELGNVPPELLFSSFEMLRPAGRTAGTLRLASKMGDDEFVRSFLMFDKWGADQIPFPGECFRQTTKELTWANKLYKNELELDGRLVDLKKVTAPLLNVSAQHDHIAPYEATKDVTSLVGSTDLRDISLKGGHVSLVAGGNAMYRLWPQLNSWLAERSI